MYYLLGRSSASHPCRHVDAYSYPSFPGLWWDDGARFTQPIPIPIEISLKPLEPLASDHGPDLPAIFLGRIPLFREDFIAALIKGGVDNLELHEARLTDPDTGAAYTNYKAVNIIGLVSAADLGRSTAIIHDNIPLVDVGFDKLVIDEGKAGGALLFRLAENNTAVLVHERLRDHLLDEGFTELEFYNLDEVAL